MKRIFVMSILAAGLALAQGGAGKGPSTDGTSPVPEPGTIGMLAAGLTLFSVGAWRKSRKR